MFSAVRMLEQTCQVTVDPVRIINQRHLVEVSIFKGEKKYIIGTMLYSKAIISTYQFHESFHLTTEKSTFLFLTSPPFPITMQYSIFLAAALFGVKALSHSVPVYSSFWIGQISGEQECGVGGGGGASSACNEGGTWASSDLSNFCDHVGVGSVFPAAKGPKTNWCNVTVS